MGLFDLFSDSNEKAASNKLKKGYKQGFKAATKNLNKGFKGLKKDYAKALNQITKGQDRSVGAIDSATTQATGAVTGGRDAALAEYQPYVDAGKGASQLYSDALGLNGAAGNANAVSAFQTGPGYDFMMNQGLDAIDRRAASRGLLGSGNTRIDTANYVTGLANQEYGSWLDRLAGQQGFGAGIAGARAGIHTGAGGNLASIYGNAGNSLADIYTGAAGDRANIRTGLGQARYDVGGRMADLSYATRLGQAGAGAQYEAGKDASALGPLGTVAGIARTAVLGGPSLGSQNLRADPRGAQLWSA